MLNIRHAIPDDASAIAKLHIDSCRAAYKDILPEARSNGLDHVRVTESFRKSISFGAEDIYIVENSGRISGFIALIGDHHDHADKETVPGICTIYLAPEYWRKGIGRLMYQEGETILKSAGCTAVTFWVFADNMRARRFYEAMGFTVDGEAMVLNMGSPLNAVHYRKDIGCKPAGSARIMSSDSAKGRQ
jgi:ribosomal protein S18 acetylase RimI-like enzyme